jgi:hypothetical protein
VGGMILLEVDVAGSDVHELQEGNCAYLCLKGGVFVPKGGLEIFDCLDVIWLVHKLRYFLVDSLNILQIFQLAEAQILHNFYIVDQL